MKKSSLFLFLILNNFLLSTALGSSDEPIDARPISSISFKNVHYVEQTSHFYCNKASNTFYSEKEIVTDIYKSLSPETKMKIYNRGNIIFLDSYHELSCIAHDYQPNKAQKDPILRTLLDACYDYFEKNLCEEGAYRRDEELLNYETHPYFYEFISEDLNEYPLTYFALNGNANLIIQFKPSTINEKKKTMKMTASLTSTSQSFSMECKLDNSGGPTSCVSKTADGSHTLIFKDRTQLTFDGEIFADIGPNGGFRIPITSRPPSQLQLDGTWRPHVFSIKFNNANNCDHDTIAKLYHDLFSCYAKTIPLPNNKSALKFLTVYDSSPIAPDKKENGAYLEWLYPVGTKSYDGTQFLQLSKTCPLEGKVFNFDEKESYLPEKDNFQRVTYPNGKQVLWNGCHPYFTKTQDGTIIVMCEWDTPNVCKGQIDLEYQQYGG